MPKSSNTPEGKSPEDLEMLDAQKHEHMARILGELEDGESLTDSIFHARIDQLQLEEALEYAETSWNTIKGIATLDLEALAVANDVNLQVGEKAAQTLYDVIWINLVAACIRAIQCRCSMEQFQKLEPILSKERVPESRRADVARIWQGAIMLFKQPVLISNYIDFAANTNALKGEYGDALDFLAENAIALSECFDAPEMGLLFSHILKNYSQGDVILQKMWVSDYEGKKDSPRGYFLHHCLSASGGYAKAKEAAPLAKKSLSAGDRDPSIVDKALKALIPPFTLEELVPAATDDEIDRQVQMGEMTSGMGKLWKEWNVHVRSGNYKACVKWLIQVFHDQKIANYVYRQFVGDYCKQFIDNPHHNGQQRAKEDGSEDPLEFTSMAIEELLNAASDRSRVAGVLRVPGNILNVLYARKAELFYKAGDNNDEIIRDSAQIYQISTDSSGEQTGGVHEFHMLRGQAYYWARAIIDRANQGKARKKKTISGVNYKKDLLFALGILMEYVHEFAGTKWEREIWMKYVLPIYFEHGDNDTTLTYPYEGSRLPSILDDCIKKRRKGWEQAMVMRLKVAFADDDKPKGWRKYASDLAGVDMPAHLSWEVKPLLLYSAKELVRNGQLEAAIELLEKAKRHFKDDLTYLKTLLDLLLSRTGLSEVRYRRALEVLEANKGRRFVSEYDAKVEEARRDKRVAVPKHAKLGLADYFEQFCSNDDDHELIKGHDGLAARVAERELDGLESLLVEELEEVESLQEGWVEAEGNLRTHFGVKRAKGRRKSVNVLEFEMELIPEKGQELDPPLVVVGMDRRHLSVLGLADLEYDRGFSLTSILACELGVLALDLAGNSEAAVYGKELSAAISVDNPQIEIARKRLAIMEAADLDGDPIEGVDEREMQLESLRGKELLSMRNALFVNIVAQQLPLLRQQPNFLSDAQINDLKATTRGMIKRDRYRDHPVVHYDSAIHPESPFYDVFANLRIFNHGRAAARLKALGCSDRDLKNWKLIDPPVNNFAGYYELHCELPGAEKLKPLVVFLDEEGEASIPGVPNDHELFRYIELVVLQSLALKVVPHLGRIVGYFFKDPDTERAKKRQSWRMDYKDPNDFDPEVGDLEIGGELERFVASIVVHRDLVRRAKSEDASVMTGAHIDAMLKVSELYSAERLAAKGIAAWPIYARRKDKKLVEVPEMFVNNEEGEVCLSLEEFANFFHDAELELVDTGNDEVAARIRVLEDANSRVFTLDNLVVRLEDLPPELFKIALSKMKVRRRTGFLYRQPIVLHHEQPGGVFKRVRVNGSTVYLKSKSIGDEQRKIAKEVLGIEARFDTERGVISLLYDRDEGRIVRSAYLGSAQRGGGKGGRDYQDANVQRLWDINNRGGIAMREVVKDLPDGDYEEVFTEMDINAGFRQGLFVDLLDAARRESFDPILRDARGDIKRKVLKDSLEAALKDDSLKREFHQMFEAVRASVMVHDRGMDRSRATLNRLIEGGPIAPENVVQGQGLLSIEDFGMTYDEFPGPEYFSRKSLKRAGIDADEEESGDDNSEEDASDKESDKKSGRKQGRNDSSYNFHEGARFKLVPDDQRFNSLLGYYYRVYSNVRLGYRRLAVYLDENGVLRAAPIHKEQLVEIDAFGDPVEDVDEEDEFEKFMKKWGGVEEFKLDFDLED